MGTGHAAHEGRPPSANGVPLKTPKPLPRRPRREEGPGLGMGPPARQGRLGTPGPPLPGAGPGSRARPASGGSSRVPAQEQRVPFKSAQPRPPPPDPNSREAGRRRRAPRTRRWDRDLLRLGRRLPSAARPAPVPPGRCSPRPRDEPGERGDPPATPARHTVKQTQRRQPRASVSRGCVTLGSPAPSLGGSPADGQGCRQPFRVPAHRHQSGAREAPWRRGLAQAGRRIRHAGLEGRAPLPTAPRP